MAKRIQRNVNRGSTAAPPSSSGEAPRRRASAVGRRVSGQLVTEFTVQLATLTSAGIPVVRSLTILHGQARPGPFKEVLADLVEDVSAGTPLSEAMSKRPRAFDNLYSSMVRAGETGGVLGAVLERVAKFRERAAEIRSKVTGAMIYPVVVLVVALSVVAAVITFVIPRFKEVFKSFDIEMPRPTQILLDVSDVTVQYWYLVFGVPLLLLVLHFVFLARGGAYRRLIHRWILKIPYLGQVMVRSNVAAFARTFGTLVQAGVPHLDALEISRETAANETFRLAIEDVRRTVREGETIARPMGESGVFDDLVTNMVEVGEQTGELDSMLLRVAEAYEAQTERKIDALFKVIEPALLIALAGFVGFIVVALFVPLTKIMSAVSVG
ncbi:type II secretion system F family protein [Engelhardtia mirabilis]|uniref:Type II secretion system protein F n=1 Tax=Engelhardtia mirabilis TaxID=2528011 RepID=A0A518BJ51_9BACT|nr:Putative type II secretion system protein F [Planctomycetes bacterium Pla133]QDV01334.1 Putative type II secretion system protein F [Planctomycetes bacterium Pla86]